MTDKATLLTDRGLGVGTTSERVGIAIVGLGRGPFSSHGAKAFRTVALRWVVDIDEPLVQRVAGEGCKGSTSIDAALADRRSRR